MKPKKQPQFTEKTQDFPCDCGCGQKLRVEQMIFKNGVILDIGLIPRGKTTPMMGVVLRTDRTLLKFLKALPKKRTTAQRRIPYRSLPRSYSEDTPTTTATTLNMRRRISSKPSPRKRTKTTKKR